MKIIPLTPAEERAYVALVELEKEKAAPEADAIKEKRIQDEAPRLAAQRGISEEQATEAIRSRSNGKLQPEDTVNFQAHGKVAVSYILAEPSKYDKQYCADPLEPWEGTNKAIFNANKDTGTPLIHSMLHGGSNYYLQHNTEAVAATSSAEQQAPSQKSKNEIIHELTGMLAEGEVSTEKWCEIVASANLSPIDEDGIIRFLSNTMQTKKTLLKKAFQDYQDRAGARINFDKLQEMANGRVLLKYEEHELNAATENSERAILAVEGEWPYFSHGNILSYSTYDCPSKHSIGIDNEKPPKVPVIKTYTRDSLHLRVEQSVLHYKEKRDKGSNIVTPFPIATPQPIINKLIEHPSPLAPRVSGLVSHPVLSLEGRLIDKECIDKQTGLLLQFGGSTFHQLPVKITQAAAQAASQRIFNTLFSEFCFREIKGQKDLYRMAALAFLLTGIFRKVIDQAPGYLIVANVQGSGKTSLARIVHVMLTGRDMPVSSLGGNTEEMKKEMLAMFMQSPAMVCYDNILDGSEINDPILAKAITSSEFKGRILGKTQEATVPTNTVIAITGNNVTLSADLVRRFITVGLTADIAQPENKIFKNPDIVQHCLNNRRDVFKDCLIITKGFIDAGCPVHAEKYGSSGLIQWDRMVRFPLLWATGVDVLESMNQNRQQSTEHVAMTRVINCLKEIFGSGVFTASQVMEILQNEAQVRNKIEDALREGLVMMSSKALRSIKSLAWVLKKLDGRIIDGMILRKEQIRNRSDEYRIERTSTTTN